ncbi:MAG: YceI family protein [Flavobacteriaceae bacterium]|nr:YceI family protein [Eudoraea sp.]NNJ37667.1 YceI family protein [Flavobacteriaceae bacterium]
MSFSKSLFLCSTVALLGINMLFGQGRYKTTRGIVEFNASTPLEDIEAINREVNAILSSSGEFAVVLLIRDFQFPRKLMQEHFNENYLESDTYPKSYFTGKMEAIDPNLISETPENVKLTGKLKLHGITKKVSVPGTIYRTKKGIRLESSFIIRPEDYGIDIPTLMFKKIAKEVKTSFTFELIKM